MRNPVLLAVLFAALSTPSFAQKATPQQAAPQAVPVTTVIAQEKPVAQTKDFVGRVEAIDRVQVRARVTGYLEAVLFKEGEMVKEGHAWAYREDLHGPYVSEYSDAEKEARSQHLGLWANPEPPWEFRNRLRMGQ